MSPSKLLQYVVRTAQDPGLRILPPLAVPLIPIPHASAAGYQLKRLPVLVMLHGSGVDGNYIISHYQSLADKYKCVANPCSAAGPVSCCTQLLCMSVERC